MADILALATAGLRPDQLNDTEHARYPRVDYLELQRCLNMDVLDYDIYNHARLGSMLRRLDTVLRSDLYLTLAGLLAKRTYRLVFAMSERVGIPFAGLHRILPHRRPLVTMFTCWSARQERMITRLNLFAAMDSIIVKCQSMKEHFIKLGAPAERIHVIPYAVDQRFFMPLPQVEQQNGFVMSLGETRTRDYATLFRAIDGLSMKLLVAASGSWYAREKDTSLPLTIPDNVTVTKGFSRSELKTLYARAQFVVLPVYDQVFSAGATGVLEAMCMGRAVVVTRSRGIIDYVIDGETGILVDQGDVAGMREAIQYLLAHPEESRRMGANARRRIETELNLDRYVENIAHVLHAHL